MADTPTQQESAPTGTDDYLKAKRITDQVNEIRNRALYNVNKVPGNYEDRYGNRVTGVPTGDDMPRLVNNRLVEAGKGPHEQHSGFQAEYRPEGGGKFKRTGFGALAGMRDEYGRPVYTGNQRARLLAERGSVEDVRDTFPFSMARNMKNSLTDKSEEGSFLNTLASSSIGSTATGAGIGAGTAALAAYLANQFGLDIISPATASMIGAGLGSAAGWKTNRVYTGKDELPSFDWANDVIDWTQRKAMQVANVPPQVANMVLKKHASVEKKAAMYHDPRNFILEKLQRDNELSMADKATLAGRIRNMSLGEASQLETLVRGALGIGVGAIIARFFGLGLLGTIAGAGLGAWASTRFSERKPQFGAIFDNGGDGFSTYNEFLGATYF